MRSCRRLQTLGLCGCAAISDGCVGLLAQQHSLRSLMRLDLSYRGDVSPETLRAIAVGCPKLRRLALSAGATEDSMRLQTLATELFGPRGVWLQWRATD